MEYLPLFHQIANQSCLVIGGGQVALRKIEQLLAAGAAITVISPDISDDVLHLAEADQITWQRREYEAGDCTRFRLVIATTNDADVNRAVYAECTKLGIPVNVVDQPELCSVIFPSIIRRSFVTIAVSTGGQAPFLTKALRKELEAFLDDVEILQYESLIAAFRKFVMESVTDVAVKKRLYGRLLLRSKTDWEAWSYLDEPPAEWYDWLKEEREGES